jgi:sugar lactone lactonase YvrE
VTASVEACLSLAGISTGVLYATGTPDLTGVWRLSPGRAPVRIAALPSTGLPNGLALNPQTGVLYIADSVLGKIFSVSTRGGTAATFSAAPELASTGFLGVNGVKSTTAQSG